MAGHSVRSVIPKFCLPALLISALALLPGCAAKRVVMTPAPNATLASLPNAAEGRNAGVLIVVQADAWDGHPRSLDTKVTPLSVTITNNSNHPLAIRYKNFVLSGQNNKEYAAIPPYNIRGSVYAEAAPAKARYQPAAYVQSEDAGAAGSAHQNKAQQNPPAESNRAAPRHRGPFPRSRVIITPGFGWSGFYLAPWWGYAYPGLGWWPYAWSPDWGYYHTYYQHQLPTRSMLQKAIPEGVIAEGGSVNGFIYFQKPDSSKSQTLDFQATLVDANTHQTFGNISIPFVERPR